MWHLWVHHDNEEDKRAISANMGSRVVINRPSYRAKKPMPIAAPIEPSNGKHEAYPIAETNAPRVDTLSVITLNLIIPSLPPR